MKAERAILHAAFLWANLVVGLAQKEVCADGRESCTSSSLKKGALATHSNSLLQSHSVDGKSSVGWEEEAPTRKDVEVLAETEVQKYASGDEGYEEEPEETAETWCKEGCKTQWGTCMAKSGLAQESAVCYAACLPVAVGCVPNAKTASGTEFTQNQGKQCLKYRKTLCLSQWFLCKFDEKIGSSPKCLGRPENPRKTKKKKKIVKRTLPPGYKAPPPRPRYAFRYRRR